MKAYVKWFNNSEGIGFAIIPGEEDVFIHYSKINGEGFKTLDAGDLIEFDLVNTEKGKAAENITLINGDV